MGVFSNVTEPFYVLLIGQSQIPGTLDLGFAPSVYEYNQRVWMINNDEVLRKAANPVDRSADSNFTILDDPDAFGPCMHIGEVLARKIARRIVMIPVAKGGTTSEDWLPNGDFLNSCMSILDNVPRLDLIIEAQGESDCLTDALISPETHVSNWQTIISAIRAHMNDNTIPAIYNSLHEWNAGIPNRTEANWNGISGTAATLATADVYGYSADQSACTGQKSDRIHLSVVSCTTNYGDNIGIAFDEILAS